MSVSTAVRGGLPGPTPLGSAGADDLLETSPYPPAYVVAFLATILADTISGNSAQLGFPLPPQRLFLAGSLLLLALDRRVWRRVRLVLRPVHVAALAFIGWVLWSAASVGTLTTSIGGYALIDRILVPLTAFVLAPVVFATERDRDLLLKTLTLLGLYLGVTAVLESFGPHALVFPRYIVDAHVGIQYGRARGPFVESEDDGLVMSACAFAGGVLAWRIRGRWRTVGVLTTVAGAAGILLTLTRSNWIGAGLAALLTFVAVPRLRRYAPVLIVATTVTLAAVLAFIPALDAKVTGRLDTSRSLYDRFNTDDAALRVIDAHPLTGIGWERFLAIGTDYVRQGPTYPITNVGIEVHNVFLGRAAELGIPAALVFVLMILLGPVRAVLRPARGDLQGWRVLSLAVLVTWLVCAFLSPLPYSTANLLLWLLPGVTLAPYLSAPRRSPGPRAAGPGPRAVGPGFRAVGPGPR